MIFDFTFPHVHRIYVLYHRGMHGGIRTFKAVIDTHTVNRKNCEKPFDYELYPSSALYLINATDMKLCEH